MERDVGIASVSRRYFVGAESVGDRVKDPAEWLCDARPGIKGLQPRRASGGPSRRSAVLLTFARRFEVIRT